jgi:hypothetical protein
LYTVKKVDNFPVPILAGKHSARESLVSDIPAGDGKIVNLSLQCTLYLAYNDFDFFEKIISPDPKIDASLNSKTPLQNKYK